MTSHPTTSHRANQAPSNGLILAGTQSSSGKTAITCLLLAAFAERGFSTQSFKVGPDFIDPSYHATFSKDPCRNLDTWLMGQDEVREEVRRHTIGKIGLAEGVMGLFDGGLPHSADGSTMELAEILNWPIILILPSAKAGRSLAATLRGFLEEAGPGRIHGVILNQVSGDSHRSYLTEALAPLKVPILGALPQLEMLHWPERHLGLQAAQESVFPSRKEMASFAETHLDIAAILSFFDSSKTYREIGCLPSLSLTRFGRDDNPVYEANSVEAPDSRKRIAIAKDEVFHFYYPSNLDYLIENGFDLVEFSPLHDDKLPTNISGLIIGGGFPEVFAPALADNYQIRRAVKSALDNGLPCYAECGGLMYLANELVSLAGKTFPMVGIIPGKVAMTQKLQNFGYCLVENREKEIPYRGHEFHYSRWDLEEPSANLWQVRRRRGGASRNEGYRARHFQASYVHLFWKYNAGLLRQFFADVEEFKL